MKATLAPVSTFTVAVRKSGDSIAASRPITVKNQINEINTLDDIPGVNTALQEDGAVLIYNANTGQYDVKLPSFGINGFSYATGNNTLIITAVDGTHYYATINTLNNITLTGNTSIDAVTNIRLDAGEF